MGAPHNINRYGEEWNPDEFAVMQQEIDAFKDLVVVSGGWAWHFMSPSHVELKHAHDHKDADLFVDPNLLWQIMPRLTERGYEKTWTGFDGVTENFVRYTKTVNTNAKPVKVIFDLFTEKVQSVETSSGIRMVVPEYLLSLYGKKHSSVECFSVQIAKALISKGESLVGHPAMAEFRKFLKVK